MKSKFLLVLAICSVASITGWAQQNTTSTRIVFYNVENLFDVEDDSLTLDEEFLPKGERHWTSKKLFLKYNRIYQVIMAAGDGKLPAFIGMCEVENRKVLEALIHFTPLERLNYSIVHKESPDVRGIDVALLYNKNLFRPLSFSAIPVTDPNDVDFRTRDILFVKGIIQNDTVCVFVNHWPSKYGGLLASEPKRTLAAKTLKHVADSLLNENENCKIIIMGDFNDGPLDESVAKVLNAMPVSSEISKKQLYNLAYDFALQGLGSYKYQESWNMIDQLIVSGNLLYRAKLYTTQHDFKIFKAPFLLENDKTNLGDKPFRTYVGYKYNNGFSDHLPIVLDLYFTPVN